MKNIIILFAISLFFLYAPSFTESAEHPTRIVSMAPSITEILYKLGQGDKVVGVTDYCIFPDEVKYKPRIGSYLNPNYEAIFLLKPDLVIMITAYSEEFKSNLDKMDIRHITVNNLTIDGILASIEQIGRVTGAGEKAKKILSRIDKELENLRERAKDRPRRRVMVVVGRNKGSLENLYIAGKGTFYDEFLTILGCENVYIGTDFKYITISVEGVLRLNPDVIIEMLPGYPEEKKPEVIAEWAALKDVNAVRNNRVYVFNEDYISIPGPRFTLILQDLENVLYRTREKTISVEPQDYKRQ